MSSIGSLADIQILREQTLANASILLPFMADDGLIEYELKDGVEGLSKALEIITTGSEPDLRAHLVLRPEPGVIVIVLSTDAIKTGRLSDVYVGLMDITSVLLEHYIFTTEPKKAILKNPKVPRTDWDREPMMTCPYPANWTAEQEMWWGSKL